MYRQTAKLRCGLQSVVTGLARWDYNTPSIWSHLSCEASSSNAYASAVGTPSRIRTSLQVMGVSMSKFSAMTRSELHLFSLKLQVGALTNSPTMGGESATTEQSAPVKPDTDILLLLGRIASVATYIYFNLFMAALWNRTGHFIFALLLFSSSSFFFSRLISAAADWMSTILPHTVWPVALERI